MSSFEKTCLFCGTKPKNKTKEHIIPKWLIELTGVATRDISLGIDTKKFFNEGKFEIRKFSFSNFQFPACNECNNFYSLLESKTKPIILKILNNDFLDNIEITTLLDWFDKVRTGLWIGFLTLDKNVSLIDKPSFYINKRLCEKDRSLFVYELEEKTKCIQFIGVNSPSFQISPNCFALRINNFYFFNSSTDFLIAKNIGFPYAKKYIYRNEDRMFEIDFGKGSNKIKFPIFKGSFLLPSIEIYQPIIGSKLGDFKDSKLLYNDSEYVQSNLIDKNNGIGNIFYIDDKQLLTLDNETEISFSNDNIKYKEESIKIKL